MTKRSEKRWREMLDCYLIVELTKSYTLRVVYECHSFAEMQKKLDDFMKDGKKVFGIRAFY